MDKFMCHGKKERRRRGIIIIRNGAKTKKNNNQRTKTEYPKSLSKKFVNRFELKMLSSVVDFSQM
jgi:hypothetical protein